MAILLATAREVSMVVDPRFKSKVLMGSGGGFRS